MVKYSIDEQDKIGHAIAKLLCMKKDMDYKDRYQTTWGNKTGIGIFNTIIRLNDDIKSGAIKKEAI